MPLLLAILLVLIIVALFWVTANVIGVLVYLVIAGLIGALADAVVPGRLPFGWLGAILAGIIGSWIGVRLMGPVGPAIAGIPVIPALVGAFIFAIILELVLGMSRRRRVF